MTGQPPRRSNLRTALVIGSIALAFFLGIIVKQYLLSQ
ncbi:cytochrome oxidase small assembly protein [Chitiniphilus shinanonensis]|nr:cytochrome oxidase small assembly protein [Chitiniphilus shinanonensis]